MTHHLLLSDSRSYLSLSSHPISILSWFSKLRCSRNRMDIFLYRRPGSRCEDWRTWEKDIGWKKTRKKRGKSGNHLFDVLRARRTLKKGAPPVKSALLLPLLMHMHNTCCCWDHFLGLPSFSSSSFNPFSHAYALVSITISKCSILSTLFSRAYF